MTKIGLMGDIHGDKTALRALMKVMHFQGYDKILQAGDFGIYRNQHNQEFLKLSSDIATEYGQTLYITPGNHEDWTWINQLHAEEKRQRGGGWTQLRDNVLIAPRGLRWEWDGVSFLSLGGAPSVDRGWRKQMDDLYPKSKNPLWDAGEAITLEDAQKAMDGGHADVMITHDAPLGVPTIEDRIRGNPLGFHWADLAYALEGRELMKQVVDSVQPYTFIHGHYHFSVSDRIYLGREEWCHVFGLNCELNNGSVGVYDTETRTAEFLDWKKIVADNV